jgi:hypothetical protein
LAGGFALAFPQLSQASLLANVVFNDTTASNGSTYNSAGQSYSNAATPTSTSTNYDVASGKPATAGFNGIGNALEIGMPSTSSGIAEVQAVFAGGGSTPWAPVVLASSGDEIELTVTFYDSAQINSSSSSAVYLGLYTSGGSAPDNDLQNSGIGGGTNDVTNGVQNWLGYEGDAFAGAKAKLFVRPQQTGSTNANQALVGDSQTGGVQNPTGAQPGNYSQTNAGTGTLVAGNYFTDELSITLSGGQYNLSDAFYSGQTDTGTPLESATGSLSALPGGDGFDGLAIGYRETNSHVSEMDITNVEVTTTEAVPPPVPEPASVGILGLAGLGLLRRRPRKT